MLFLAVLAAGDLWQSACRCTHTVCSLDRQPHLHQDLVVFQGLKVLFSHLNQVHICALVLSKLELDVAPCVLKQKEQCCVCRHAGHISGIS